jgi:transmembrane sensor
LKRPDDEQRERAAAWFSVERRGLMSSGEREQLEAWRADPEHRAALEGMHALWNELSGLKGGRLQGSTPARRRTAWPLALAASLLLAVAGGAMWWQLQMRSPLYTVQTAVGEQRSATLPDGSRVELNVVTHIDYRLSAGHRDVRMLDGEALFFVHKDAAHPFIVRTGSYEVRAVGTAFNVRAREGLVQVAMLEGVVSVRALEGPQAGRIVAELRQGEKLSLAGPAAPIEIEHIPAAGVAPWRQHTLSYQDVPVAQVVADMNRLFLRPLQVPDPALAARRVTLRLQVQDREHTLQTLSGLLGAKILNGDRADVIVGPM